MKATTEGVSCSRAELTALLATASQDSADKNKWGVLFVCDGEKVFARATNGFGFLQFEGISERKKTQTWMVNRKYLVDCQKELEAKQVVLFQFKGASLHEAAVMENDKELGTWTSKEDATIRQVAFPWEYDSVGIPDANRKIAHCATVSAPYLKIVMLAAKAVKKDEVVWYGPESAHGDLTFRVGIDEKTSAIGWIKPLPADQAENDGGGDGAPELDEEDDEAAA
jgi:hypothetical protein